MKEVSEEIKDRYATWKPIRDRHLKYSTECKQLYQNNVEGTHTNYTRDQLNFIKDTTNIPTTVNHMFPIVQQMLALLVENKIGIDVVTFDGRHKGWAQVMGKMVKALLTSSKAFFQMKNYIQERIITGLGHIAIVPDDDYQRGRFKLRVKFLPEEVVILDPNIKDESNDDAEGCFIEREMTLTRLIQIYGATLKNVIDKNGNPIDLKNLNNYFTTGLKASATVTTSKIENRVTVLEYFDKLYTTLYKVEDPKTRDVLNIFKENFASLEEADIATLKTLGDVSKAFVRKTIIIGDMIIWEEILPITNFPIITSYFDWSGKPYESFGLAHYVKGMQEAYDKLFQIMLVNGMITNNAGYKSPKGAIAPTDRVNWEKHANNPFVVKEYQPVVIEGEVLFPEREQIQQIGNFYPITMQQMSDGMKYTTGVNDILSGNTSDNKIEVFSTLQQYQTAAMQRVMLSVRHIESASEFLGDVLLQYLIAQINPNEDYMFYDEKGQLNEFTIAREMDRDIKLGEYSVMAVPGKLLPSQRLAVGNTIAGIAQSEPDPVSRKILTTKAMGMLDVPELDETVQQMDVASQLQSTVAQLQEQLKRLEEMNKQLENQIVNTRIENAVIKGAHDTLDQMSTKEAEHEKNLEMDRMKGKMEIDMKKKEVELKAKEEKIKEKSKPKK